MTWLQFTWGSNSPVGLLYEKSRSVGMLSSTTRCSLSEWLFEDILQNIWDLPSNLEYKLHLSRQYNCWSLRCSCSIACRHCSNYIFILYLTPGFNGLGRHNCKTQQETFTCWDLVQHNLEVWWYKNWYYKLVQYNKIACSTSVIQLDQNIRLGNSKKAPNISSPWISYGVTKVRILKKNYHVVMWLCFAEMYLSVFWQIGYKRYQAVTSRCDRVCPGQDTVQ